MAITADKSQTTTYNAGKVIYLADFATKFQAIEEMVRSAGESVLGKFDRFTFKLLVNNLKSPDFQVVKDTLEQLGKEKRPVAIPPVFYVYAEHPDNRLRVLAEKSLQELDPTGEWQTLTKGKSTKEGVTELINKFGHYRA